ncbi:MAG: mevalonate kinase [Motiliproteus sp.]|nr:mevalonate kinase [Motiliproteus sp.]
MIARAPAKAIVSGEHAVVYGAPALAIAIARYAEVRVVRQGDPDQLTLILADLNHQSRIDRQQLLHQTDTANQHYQDFLAGTAPIKAVLQQPSSLYFYAIGTLLQLFPDLPLGLEIRIKSDIPLGSGMGSSAATVAAMLAAIAADAGLKLSDQQLFELSHGAEQLQHGRSSGLDPAVCCWGGMLRFQDGKFEKRTFSNMAGWYLLDSGRPSVSTGECGVQVRQQFLHSDIWTEFAEVTNSLEQAISGGQSELILDSIRVNQRLLSHIGVVPERVQQLVAQIEAQGGAAKISGAGAVAGDNAGLVLVYCPDKTVANALTPKMTLTPLQVAANGAASVLS